MTEDIWEELKIPKTIYGNYDGVEMNEWLDDKILPELVKIKAIELLMIEVEENPFMGKYSDLWDQLKNIMEKKE